MTDAHLHLDEAARDRVHDDAEARRIAQLEREDREQDHTPHEGADSDSR
jgi:hypothetical protein